MFDLAACAACAGEGALPRLLMHQPTRSNEIQRDPKSTGKTRASEGFGGLSVNSEKGKEHEEIIRNQGSIEKAMKTGGKTAALPAARQLCAVKA